MMNNEWMIPHNVFVCKEAYKIRPAIDKPKRVKWYGLKEFWEQWIDLLECALEEHRRRTIYWKSLPDLALEKLYKQDKKIQRLKNDKEELRIKDNDNFWEIRKLKEENKKLKKNIQKWLNWMSEIWKTWQKIISRLEKENKELKAEIERRKEVVKELNNYNKLRIAENNELKKLLTIKNK